MSSLPTCTCGGDVGGLHYLECPWYERADECPPSCFSPERVLPLYELLDLGNWYAKVEAPSSWWGQYYITFHRGLMELVPGSFRFTGWGAARCAQKRVEKLNRKKDLRVWTIR